jgi:hypothetical protein
VFQFASGLWRWWQVLHQPFEPATPYAVPCACGAVVSGTRKAASQVRICPLCKQKVFILGKSPLPPVRGDDGGVPHPSSHARFHRNLAIAGIGVALVGIGSLVALLLRGNPHDSDSARQKTIETHELREADLVANRLPDHERLSDLLMRWNNIDEKDLQMLFAERRGKAVAFDILISRDHPGSYSCERHLGPELPRLELARLRGLDPLPLRQRQRVIFGAKLASLKCDRTRPVDVAERWTVGLEPDSFVLITDEEIGRAMGLVIDDEAHAVLERQRGWLK